jgi:hypothetical protein
MWRHKVSQMRTAKDVRTYQHCRGYCDAQVTSGLGHFETSRRIVAAAGPPPIADLWPGGRRFRGGGDIPYAFAFCLAASLWRST